MSNHQKYLEKLEAAVLTGQIEEVERLTRNESKKYIWSPKIIKKAISAGQLKAAKLIIKRGGSYLWNDILKDNKILHASILTGDLELVQLLLWGTRASIKLVDKDGIPPIFKLVHITSDNVDYSQFFECLLYRETKTERINIMNGKHQSRSFTILHYAAENGNAKIIPVLQQRQCQLNSKTSDESNALHVAAKNRHALVVRVLLEHGVKATQVNKEQMTPLHIAIKNNDFEIFGILFNHITQSTAAVRQYFHKEVNRPLVYLAVSAGNIRMVELLLSKEAVLTYAQKETGKTALHLAIEKEDIPMVELLLKHETKLETADKSGFTPLHAACLKGNPQIVSMLLDTNKCRLGTKSTKGLTPLHLAAREGYPVIVSLLLEKGANYKQFDTSRKTALSFALENTSGDEKTLIVLLKHIRQMDNSENNSVLLPDDELLIKYHTEAKSDKDGNSALHLAVQKQDKSAIKMILKLYACIDIQNKSGHTPFDLATYNASLPIVKIFLKSRSNPKTLFMSSGEGSLTPMHLAVEEGKTDMLQAFFKAGVTAEVPYFKDEASKPIGITPLHIAVRKGDKDLIYLLLKNGAKVEALGRDDFDSPLFTAAEIGNTEVLEILIEAATSRSTEWKEGYLPMCIAAYRGHEKIVQMLLDHGTDLNANFDTYLTPLHAAAQRGHEKIVRLLLEHGAMANPKCKSGEFISTPLLGAIYSKHNRIAQLLLNQGADFNAQLLPHCTSKPSHSITNSSVLVTKQILTQGSYKDSEIGENGSLVGYRPLLFAVQAGDKAVVKSLLNSGASVNFKAKNGATAIGLAIEQKNEVIIKLLFSAGANVSNLHKNKSILDIAVLKTDVKLAEFIVKYVASSHPDLEDKKVTPLGVAVENELEACVERFLQAGASPLVEHNDESLLNVAVRKKNLAIVQLLVKHGIDVNYVGRDKKLALLTAVENEDLNIIELLLDAGANIQINEALYIAIEKNNDKIVDLLLRRGLANSDSDSDSESKTDSPFRRALKNSTPQVVEKFLNHKVSTDVKNSKGECPIFYAIESENLEVVLFLLNAGASINATTIKGESIIHFAMSEVDFNAKLYQILVDYNINLNAPDKDKQSPIARILKTTRYNWNVRDERNNLLNILLTNGVNANQADVLEGKTMLEHVIDNEQDSELEVLLLNGADINRLDANKKSPLQVAVDRALKISQDMEIKRGPFISQKNNSKNIENLEYDNYYVGWYGLFRSRVIVRLLIQEVARRLAAKEKVNEENKSLISSSYLKMYYEQCNTEIDLLKKTEICRGISYCDILTAKFSGLAVYAKNIKVKKAVLSETWLLKSFPKYGKILMNRIVIGRDRRYLLDSCYEFLKDLLGYNFPVLVMEHILSFLGNKDLRNLYAAKEMNGN